MWREWSRRRSSGFRWWIGENHLINFSSRDLFTQEVAFQAIWRRKFCKKSGFFFAEKHFASKNSCFLVGERWMVGLMRRHFKCKTSNRFQFHRTRVSDLEKWSWMFLLSPFEFKMISSAKLKCPNHFSNSPRDFKYKADLERWIDSTAHQSGTAKWMVPESLKPLFLDYRETRACGERKGTRKM